MKLENILQPLGLRVLTSKDKLDVEVNAGYTSDLLSDVIANSREADIWITLQTHQNIIAVAKLKDLAAIILVNTRLPDDQAIKKAEEEGIVLLQSDEPAFVVSGKLYELLRATE